MEKKEIMGWLREKDSRRLECLWQEADRIRRENVGDDVYLRGLIEIGNYCSRNCKYCGIRSGNRRITRYRMSVPEILACAKQAESFGYGTVVIQSGEDLGFTTEWITDLIRLIRKETTVAVTLMLGEREERELIAWRDAGADRYLLRFETGNPELFAAYHPALPGREKDRLGIIARLNQLGFEVGSGIMIGLPGQTWEDLADDIELFSRIGLDMIGVGPFIPHPDTPLGQGKMDLVVNSEDQALNDELTTYKVIALTRIMCPAANIPSTTALASLNRAQGRELGLKRGGNIVMPNLTPMEYRRHYAIYPAKACIQEPPEVYDRRIKEAILSLGRRVGIGRGDSPSYLKKRFPRAVS